ncbi:hypothetical protein AncyloWKF20_16740 [Ancylobacter sp. WKF20]|uniref:hypothetical protein n=1 Tax=Ancylobacter sp. WKF20 TaxID=3039801 RepID=UPI0024341272|nr:hypothetical protein [Ancylobacter sp. WKF20]WGD29403.1 hypothetical protein AncyloWKF20_16740 [Ancylobacter sp. WKF20]
MNDEITLRDLKLMASQSTPAQIVLDLLCADSPSKQLSCVERGIDYAVQEMIKVPQLYQGMTEDQLTNSMMNFLSGLGLNPTHDTQIGGHCDIVIQLRGGFLWIGESKIHGSYDWLLKGFNQIDTRYSTGMPGQDSGDLIIFIFQQRIDHVIEKWVEKLQSERTDVTINHCQTDPNRRISTHLHQRTGLPFRVRHIPVSLYFSPRDTN